MSFVFSNIFLAIFFIKNSIEKDNNLKLFYNTAAYFNKLLTSLFFEKLPPIAKNGAFLVVKSGN
jgi:hypothetical protein